MLPVHVTWTRYNTYSEPVPFSPNKYNVPAIPNAAFCTLALGKKVFLCTNTKQESNIGKETCQDRGYVLFLMPATLPPPLQYFKSRLCTNVLQIHGIWRKLTLFLFSHSFKLGLRAKALPLILFSFRNARFYSAHFLFYGWHAFAEPVLFSCFGRY